MTDPRDAGPKAGPDASPDADALDRQMRSHLGRMTAGLAPNAYTSAWIDWSLHLASSPARQMEIAQQALQRAADAWTFASRAMSGQPLSANDGLAAADPRFGSEAWSQFPFNVYARVYQQAAGLAREAVRGVEGVSGYHEDLLDFAVRQVVDAASPANQLATSPELQSLTREEMGQNLVRGFENYMDDLQRVVNDEPAAGTEAFQVGRDVAVTPGKVVFRNELIELIQYAPATPDVHAEPLLILPAWIMKYYILDLSPKNSLVRYLVSQGHTVFVVSWKNPTAEDRELGMDDYLRLGLREALDAVTAIVPRRRVHGVGYCIGGTLLTIGAAALARDGDERLASVTLLAAQTDFSEPGELALFVNPSQLALLEAAMHRDGVLKSSSMAGAFMMMRPQDLIWQPMVNTYLKGRRDRMIDLMAWNADGTRMPWKMHTEYLYRLYLDNELATNRFPVEGRPVRLSDLRIPMYVVGTETDHVAPWKSVYKVDNLVRADDFSFLLTSGGHNAGIVSGPVHPKRHYRLSTRRLGDPHLAPDDWLAATPVTAGSWWPAWQAWLAARSGERGKPPALGGRKAPYRVIEDAPGQYVRQR
jgi:polyhydroxyalkanoate synthase